MMQQVSGTESLVMPGCRQLHCLAAGLMVLLTHKSVYCNLQAAVPIMSWPACSLSPSKLRSKKEKPAQIPVWASFGGPPASPAAIRSTNARPGCGSSSR